MTQRLVFVIALCTLMVGAAATSFAGGTEDEARAAAQTMVNLFVDSWNRADGAAYGENYWPEAELVDPSGTIVQGGPAIAQEHVALWAGIFKGSHIKGEVRKVQVLCPNNIIVDFDAVLSGIRELPPGSPAAGDGVLRNHLKHILQKRDGVWKILSAQNTFIAPARNVPN